MSPLWCSRSWTRRSPDHAIAGSPTPFFLWVGKEQTSKLRYEKVGGKSSEMHPESSLIGLQSAFGKQLSLGAVVVAHLPRVGEARHR